AVTPTTTNVRTGLIVRATPELGTASPRVGRARVGAQIAGGIRNFTGDARREAPERETANKQYRQRTKRPIGFLHHFLRMARELVLLLEDGSGELLWPRYQSAGDWTILQPCTGDTRTFPSADLQVLTKGSATHIVARILIATSSCGSADAPFPRRLPRPGRGCRTRYRCRPGGLQAWSMPICCRPISSESA